MVRTGDQAVERVSRQMAPYKPNNQRLHNEAVMDNDRIYRLAADIWMPDFSVELHDWRPKRVIAWNFDIDCIHPPFIWCAGWSLEGALEMCKVVPISYWICGYVRKIV